LQKELRKQRDENNQIKESLNISDKNLMDYT